MSQAVAATAATSQQRSEGEEVRGGDTALSTEVIVVIACFAVVFVAMLIYVAKNHKTAVSKAQALDQRAGKSNAGEAAGNDTGADLDYFEIECSACGGTYKSASGSTTECIECRPRVTMTVRKSPQEDNEEEHDVVRRSSMACVTPMYRPDSPIPMYKTPKASTTDVPQSMVGKLSTLMRGKNAGEPRRDANGFFDVKCDGCGNSYKSASGKTKTCVECRPVAARNNTKTPAAYSANDEHDVPRRVSMMLPVMTRNV
jgi:hypothetical protein